MGVSISVAVWELEPGSRPGSQSRTWEHGVPLKVSAHAGGAALLRGGGCLCRGQSRQVRRHRCECARGLDGGDEPFVRVEGGQGSVCNLSLTDGSDMVGVTLLRELAGKLSKRLPYLFGAGQEADPSTFVRLVLKRSQGGGAGVRLECAVGGRPGWRKQAGRV